ncbi:MAG: phosphoribosylglycinamide formyltransferase [Candidatus Omnitrophica bacterium]|nr:phosphoribosylglycinamide formyltransferase [Candidatus Omnitrophota bacterium]
MRRSNGVNIAVFASGSGTNFQALIDRVKDGYIPARIALLVSDNKDAYAVERAQKAGIETFILSPKGFKSREAYDKEIIKKLKSKEVGLVALAGFMRLISGHFAKEYKNKILNIHPALLPAFKGTHGVRDAIRYGVKVTGPTVHFVDEELDHGPIVLQDAVSVSEDDTEESLRNKVHRKEYEVYPKAVKLFVEGKLKIEGRRVRIIE